MFWRLHKSPLKKYIFTIAAMNQGDHRDKENSFHDCGDLQIFFCTKCFLLPWRCKCEMKVCSVFMVSGRWAWFHSCFSGSAHTKQSNKTKTARKYPSKLMESIVKCSTKSLTCPKSYDSFCWWMYQVSNPVCAKCKWENNAAVVIKFILRHMSAGVTRPVLFTVWASPCGWRFSVEVSQKRVWKKRLDTLLESVETSQRDV